jgi:hypothetical protein
MKRKDRNYKECVQLLQGAKQLKFMTLNPDDDNYSQKIHYMQPYMKLFSDRFGLSSESLFCGISSNDVRIVQQGFHAIDFDDFCRCLHKLSLFPPDSLSIFLTKLQTQDVCYGYQHLLHNLAQTVYLCLLYWCVPTSVLCEITRKASVGNRKCLDILTVDNLCSIKDWTSVHHTDMYKFYSLHNSSASKVFYDTFQTLYAYELEPNARICCSLMPNFVQMFSDMWKRKTAVKGYKVTEEDEVLLQKLSNRLIK